MHEGEDWLFSSSSLNLLKFCSRGFSGGCHWKVHIPYLHNMLDPDITLTEKGAFTVNEFFEWYKNRKLFECVLFSICKHCFEYFTSSGEFIWGHFHQKSAYSTSLWFWNPFKCSKAKIKGMDVITSLWKNYKKVAGSCKQIGLFTRGLSNGSEIQTQ